MIFVVYLEYIVAYILSVSSSKYFMYTLFLDSTIVQCGISIKTHTHTQMKRYYDHLINLQTWYLKIPWKEEY